MLSIKISPGSQIPNQPPSLHPVVYGHNDCINVYLYVITYIMCKYTVRGVTQRHLPQSCVGVTTEVIYKQPPPQSIARVSLRCHNLRYLDGFDLEVQRDEGKNKALEILYEIIKDPQSFWVFTVLDINQRPNLRSLK